VDIDYVTLLKAAIAGRDFVRAYAYTGLDPENENQRQFHSFLSRSGYKVVSKDIRKYGDGRIKANLDIELVVDMMKLSRNLDVAVVISGDGDFAPAIRAVQEMGVRVEVISFRGNTSSDLIEAADTFTDIVQLARVETGSSRSGRRVAAEGDLSMTEVPDKETEGLARRRRGGSGRRGERVAEPRSRTETRDRVATPVEALVPRAAVEELEPAALPANIIVLPGEKLSRVRPGTPAAPSAVAPLADVDRTPFDDVETFDDDAVIADEAPDGVAALDGAAGGEDDATADGRRRRRRRGGRGRGRGRAGEEGTAPDGSPIPAPALGGAPLGSSDERLTVADRGAAADAADAAAADLLDEDELDELPPVRLPSHSTFGSVWDSQLGVPTQPVMSSGAVGEDDFDDEPEIPEYLLAERRQRGQAPRGGRAGQGRMGGGRGGGRNAGYQSAVDRERYGRGGVPTTGSPFGAPRRDDRGGRPAPRPDRDRQGGQGGRPQGQGGQPPRPPRQDRPVRDERPQQREPQRATAPNGDPWTEVPPELEEMLRQELARKAGAAAGLAPRPTAGAPTSDRVSDAASGMPTDADADAGSQTGAPDERPLHRRVGVAAGRGPDAEPSRTVATFRSKRPQRTLRRPKRPARMPPSTRRTLRRSRPPRRRAGGRRRPDAGRPLRRRRTGPPAVRVTSPRPTCRRLTRPRTCGTAAPEAAPPKRRATRRTATAAEAAPEAAAPADAPDAESAPPKRRATRRATSTGADAPSDAAATDAPAGDDAAADAKPKRRTRKSAEALPSES
jgi:uncharacterized LabA/DUF88 family protein